MNEKEKQKLALDKFCYELIATIESCSLEQLAPIRTQLNFLVESSKLSTYDFSGAFFTLSQSIDSHREKLKASQSADSGI